MSIIASENTGPRPARCILFPPAILKAEYLGPLEEQDGKGYPRTFGCSSTLGGIPVFLFGDVSAKLPGPEGRLIGIATSAASVGSHLDPLITHWPHPKNSSAFHNVADFIPFTDEENEHNAKSKSEGRGHTDRFYLWARSPIVEIPFSGNFGVIFFTKGKTSEDVEKDDEYHGVGVAEVEMRLIGKSKGKGKVEEGNFEVMPIARRHGNHIFNNTHPKWGDIASIIKGRAYLSPRNYTFWNGKSFVAPSAKLKESLEDMGLQPVMFGLSSGTIFHSTLFSPDDDGRFIMIGSDFLDGGRVLITHSRNIWGPWEEKELLIDLKGCTSLECCTDNRSQSNVYVHIWASDLARGQLLISWNRQWPSDIEMANLHFEMMDDDSKKEVDFINFSGVPDSTREKCEATQRAMDMLLGESTTRSQEYAPEAGEKFLQILTHDENETCSHDEMLEGRRKALAKLSGECLRQIPDRRESVEIANFVKALYSRGNTILRGDNKEVTQQNTPHFKMGVLPSIQDNALESDEDPNESITSEYTKSKGHRYEAEGASKIDPNAASGEPEFDDGVEDNSPPNEQSWYTGDVDINDYRRYSLVPSRAEFASDPISEMGIPQIFVSQTDDDVITSLQCARNDHGDDEYPTQVGGKYSQGLAFAEDHQVKDGKIKSPGHFGSVKKFLGKVFKPTKGHWSRDKTFHQSTTSLQVRNKKGNSLHVSHFLRGAKSMASLKRSPVNSLSSQTSFHQSGFFARESAEPRS
ncbi:hypothetical protein DFP73DRAFT_610726 [Morchella snyderi]|nr:hypothetical protein DFP73DRAFT_610726 [Morchella snyderi]